MILAAREGHKDIVEYLVSQGADKDIENGGWTAMKYAAYEGHKDIVEYLGGDFFIESGMTRLTDAAREGKIAEVKDFIQSGDDINEKDKVHVVTHF